MIIYGHVPGSKFKFKIESGVLLNLFISTAVSVSGLVFFNWTLGNVLVLFWAETYIIVLFSGILFHIKSKTKVWKTILSMVRASGFMLVYLVIILIFLSPIIMRGSFVKNIGEATRENLLINFRPLWCALMILVINQLIYYIKKGLPQFNQEELLEGGKIVGSRIFALHGGIIFAIVTGLTFGSATLSVTVFMIIRVAAELFFEIIISTKDSQATPVSQF